MYAKLTEDRIHQGDVFQNLQFKYITEDGDTQSMVFPFWVIMSQECDLEHDFNSCNGDYKDQDKNLQTILACPAFLSDQLKIGTHMQNISLSMPTLGGDLWKKIQSNNHYRYHALASDEALEVPDLIIDFKRFFTFPRDYVYSQMNGRVTTIDMLYRENLSQRFAYYLSRIALPEGDSN